MDIKIGYIVFVKSESVYYRIISILGESVILCRMETNKFELLEMSRVALVNMIAEETVSIQARYKNRVFNFDSLDSESKKIYQTKQKVMAEVLEAYGPDYFGLTGRKKKAELDSILEKYSVNRVTFWRFCIRYFQSGFDNLSLLDDRCFGNSRGAEYHFSTKNGRKGEYGESGIYLSEEVMKYFEEALNDYKSGRQKTVKACYDYMNSLHFSKVEIINGVQTMCLKPANERPTYRQFLYFVNKRMTKKDKDIVKTSQMEFRNNKRLLTSDSLFGVNGPGDLVEIDACEADVSLVSVLNPNQTVGRPIVYFMIDVYTRAIIAVSIAFDNNSLLGVTNLFLNLADDKKEYCERYGVSFDDDRIWVSNIIPNRIRVDRGSEFKSKEFGRICNALNIQKDIVSGGSGSLKGVVEQSFRLMHLNQNEVLEDHGLIEKRYDSNHHKEATLNIDQYTKMIINFVLSHNQKFMENYPLTKDMIEKKITAIPAALWQYGIENISTPRPIINKNQYLYELMTPIRVSVSRRGVKYKGLYYYSEEPDITTLMFKAKNKSIPLEARMDMRDVGNIYVLKNTTLIQLPLNKNITGNAEYAGMTMKQYEDYLRQKRQMKAEGKVYNDELASYTKQVNISIVKEASDNSSNTYSNDKNMRKSRETEKQLVSGDNKIVDRMDVKENTNIEEKAKAIEEFVPKTKEKPKDYFNLSKEELIEERKKALELFDED